MFDLLIGTALVLGQVPIIDLRTQPLAPLPAPAQESVFVPPANVQGQVPTIDLRTQPLPSPPDPAPKIEFLPPANLPVAPVIPPAPLPAPAANGNWGRAANNQPATKDDSTKKNGDSDKEKDKKADKDEKKKKKKEKDPIEKIADRCFFGRLIKAYCDEFKTKYDDNDDDEEEKPRRALPSPWASPPFPVSEYQGYPLLGVPASDTVYPIMRAIYDANTPWTDAIKDSRIKFDGWATGSGNFSTAKNSNVPDAYWIVPNRFELEQLVFRLERYADTVQTDHIDWGFRLVGLYGMDYRYTTAGGWGSDQLLEHNKLYGWDPTEVYFNTYIPGFLGGTDIRVGRWIACPDIETQYAPDNYMASHSILFTYDTYTQTGVMVSQKINNNWMVQGVIHSGTDMAPWYKGSLLTGAFGLRWVADTNNDAIYAWVNALNSAQFRHFEQYGQPLGHDNFNYAVATWEHRFTKELHTKTEAYYMWQYNAEVGGTPSAGPLEPYGGGGGDGTLLPGLSRAYGVLNYTALQVSQQDYITLRNEYYRDERGMRTGYAGCYTSHAIGISHNFNPVFQVRPEIGYYRNWTNDAFDNGTRHGDLIYGFDCTLHF